MKYFIFLAVAFHYFASNNAQGVGTMTTETQPKFVFQSCTGKDSCKPVDGTVTVDANWRWTHDKQGKNCYTGNTWDSTLCPDGATCAKNCVLDGADYKSTYGVTSDKDGASLTLNFVTNGAYSKNIGSRLYALASDGNYQMFSLKNKRFSFTVDVSNLPCGLNGALYFSRMKKDGGKSETNLAASKYGTGYCDAQCPTDIKWINGKANSEGWKAAPNDPGKNTGNGDMGSCCPEFDVWEANSVSQAFTPHPCKDIEPTVCIKDECGNNPDGSGRYSSSCDKDGCDFASYRWGAKEFYGKDKKVDTSSPFTVHTDFVTKDGTDKGELIEIRRSYVQKGNTIQNEAVTLKELDKPFDSITDEFCDATKKLTKDTNDFQAKGGMKTMSKAVEEMVLVFSIWDDQMAEMQWLDSNYPTDKTGPGVERGTCKSGEGKPETVRSKHAGASVTFSDVKIGPIESTGNSTIQAKGKRAKRCTAGHKVN
ncbi:glycoside hydrolase [Phakopsora pachyrhizi]|uniref:Glucanase n=1 Tax=Phakopsora pachyrhizi TaxID=170000 RepID=A0AAV0AWH4_PHAPC|nr:glycoside hydrolase [Phakopsora pachyrhizi]CAH7673465.1 glycoside hydrolase [Phakopsora pachyrhizi]